MQNVKLQLSGEATCGARQNMAAVIAKKSMDCAGIPIHRR
jgi:hypothetical protein